MAITDIIYVCIKLITSLSLCHIWLDSGKDNSKAKTIIKRTFRLKGQVNSEVCLDSAT